MQKLFPSLNFLIKNKQAGQRTIFTVAALFFIFMIFSCLNRYYSFYATYDQGLFNQLFWNNLHGNFFQSSLSSDQSSAVIDNGQIAKSSYYHLGQHFVLDFLLWIPIYALFPYDATLVILRIILITLAGIVLYALARHYLSFPIAVLITTSFYGAMAVMGPTFGNFYEHCQIPLFVFSLLLALEKCRWQLFWLFVALTLGIREDTGLIIFSIGIYLIVSRRSLRLGLALCLLSFSYVILVTNVIMPFFSNDNSRLYLKSYFSQYVRENDPSTLQLLWDIASHPKEIIISLFTPFPRRVEYFFLQWLPLAFFPAISPSTWILISFPLLELLLQDSSKALAINIRYALTIVPGLFYGAILWWSQHKYRFKPWVRHFWVGCTTLSVILAVLTSGQGNFYFLIPDFGHPVLRVSLSRQWEHARCIRALMNLIPPQASVSATAFLIPPLSGRRAIIEMRNEYPPSLMLQNDRREIVEVEYILADLWHLQRYQAVMFHDRKSLQTLAPFINKLIVQGKYGILNVQDGVVLLQRATASDFQAMTDWLKLYAELRPFLPHTEMK
ncbi:MAG: DUF2079 domain-containing protein [Chroococcidiopsidaceae cyanobacterium CP_BM_ER_R8_30]|nr:DUF2079 domain-containing protein [Chroococcidiopsidaceae cyanobacterium CP_BM_ER_R8_30]